MAAVSASSTPLALVSDNIARCLSPPFDHRRRGLTPSLDDVGAVCTCNAASGRYGLSCEYVQVFNSRSRQRTERCALSRLTPNSMSCAEQEPAGVVRRMHRRRRMRRWYKSTRTTLLCATKKQRCKRLLYYRHVRLRVPVLPRRRHMPKGCKRAIAPSVARRSLHFSRIRTVNCINTIQNKCKQLERTFYGLCFSLPERWEEVFRCLPLTRQERRKYDYNNSSVTVNLFDYVCRQRISNTSESVCLIDV
jgi:hypothetical protein